MSKGRHSRRFQPTPSFHEPELKAGAPLTPRRAFEPSDTIPMLAAPMAAYIRRLNGTRPLRRPLPGGQRRLTLTAFLAGFEDGTKLSVPSTDSFFNPAREVA